jgi:hypothetical protein
MDFAIVVGYISIGAIIVGGIWKFFDWYDGKKEKRHEKELSEQENFFRDKEESNELLNEKTSELSLKVAELNVKILQIEKEIVEIKIQQDKDKSEIRKEFIAFLNEIKNDNSKQHSLIFKKLEEISKSLTTVCVSFENHLSEKPSGRKKQT